MFSRQCALERPLASGGKQIQISWIPEEFAKIGKFLKLREGDVWENGWQVASIGGRQSRQQRIDRSRDHIIQRKGSDI